MTLLVCIYPVVRRDTVERFVISISDSTRLKRDENVLDRYAQILSTINDPIFYIDKAYRFRTVNGAALRLFGKTKREMIGLPIDRVLEHL